MATVTEAAASAQTPLATALGAGLDNIDYGQTVVFTKYVRVVLPADGSVFWVKADQLSASALANAAQFNAAYYNQPVTVVTPAATITVQGSMHYDVDNTQNEDSAYARTRMIFTSKQEVEDFAEVGPTVKYVGEFAGLKFSFSHLVPFYQQAGLWHYIGDALYSTEVTQLVDDARALDTLNPVVSNSLPLWLQFSKPELPFYPSYLVPDNMPPPYIAVHIDPGSTQAIQAFPRLDRNSNQWQLCEDTVRLTTYGLRNDVALDLNLALNAYFENDQSLGIMNMPVWRDEKATQREFGIIAQKKTITFRVSYYQARARDIARQLILSAFCSVNPTPATA